MALPQPAAPAAPGPFDDGDLYDVLCGKLDYGIDFYLELARAAAGGVLEVACGTGRVLLPCLRAGVDIEGLDLHPAMLDRLRHKAEAEGFAPRLHTADMGDFALARRFALVMIPFNAFIHNLTADAQIGCLRRCREHLLPGGRLAFDTFFPGRDFLAVPDGTRVLEGEVAHPETGCTIRIYDTRSFDRVAQIQRSTYELEFLDAAGNVATTRWAQFCTRFVYASELELLLRVAGFARWQVHGGFDRRPLVNETDAMVVEAWNAG